jgi:hypothetical protein
MPIYTIAICNIIGGKASDNRLCFRGDSMKEDYESKASDNKRKVIETSVYCKNTKKKYMYELLGGEIVSERIVQCTE